MLEETGGMARMYDDLLRRVAAPEKSGKYF